MLEKTKPVDDYSRKTFPPGILILINDRLPPPPFRKVPTFNELAFFLNFIIYASQKVIRRNRVSGSFKWSRWVNENTKDDEPSHR